MRFSERIGKRQPKSIIQIETMDDELRFLLWNAFHAFVIEKVESTYLSDSMYRNVFRAIWHAFFKRPLDTLPDNAGDAIGKIRGWFMAAAWHDVYDFVEFVAGLDFPHGNAHEYIKFCNRVMEKELAGYRFIEGVLAPISNKEEVSEIEETLELSQREGLVGVNSHIKTAISSFSDKKKPDYRNSIKESVSAVESLAQIISKNPKATLGEAVKAIDVKLHIHPALKNAFSAIYGYTSDADGIRHAMLEESTADFEDAKYMLVSCSAFVNYLIAKAVKAKIDLSGKNRG